MRRVLLYLASIPPDTVALVVGCFLRALFGRRWVWRYGVLWVELESPERKFRGWFARVPYRDWGGTTFGHVVLIQHGHLDWADHEENAVELVRYSDPNTMPAGLQRDIAITIQLADHELTHVEQFEAEAAQNMVLTILSGLVGSLVGVLVWPWMLGWWALGGLTAIGSGNITAWLRGEHPYLGSHFEEAARMRVTCRRNPALAASARVT